jgi:hypothetical protein
MDATKAAAPNHGFSKKNQECADLEFSPSP